MPYRESALIALVQDCRQALASQYASQQPVRETLAPILLKAVHRDSASVDRVLGIIGDSESDAWLLEATIGAERFRPQPRDIVDARLEALESILTRQRAFAAMVAATAGSVSTAALALWVSTIVLPKGWPWVPALIAVVALGVLVWSLTLATAAVERRRWFWLVATGPSSAVVAGLGAAEIRSVSVPTAGIASGMLIAVAALLAASFLFWPGSTNLEAFQPFQMPAPATVRHILQTELGAELIERSLVPTMAKRIAIGARGESTRHRHWRTSHYVLGVTAAIAAGAASAFTSTETGGDINLAAWSAAAAAALTGILTALNPGLRAQEAKATGLILEALMREVELSPDLNGTVWSDPDKHRRFLQYLADRYEQAVGTPAVEKFPNG